MKEYRQRERSAAIAQLLASIIKKLLRYNIPRNGIILSPTFGFFNL